MSTALMIVIGLCAMGVVLGVVLLVRVQQLVELVNRRTDTATRSLDLSLRGVRDEVVALRGVRDDVTGLRSDLRQELAQLRLENMQLREELARQLNHNEQRVEQLRATVDAKLGQIRDDNAQRLEQMRLTVEEKLQSTLERRLGESFRVVGEQLDRVQRGLGEMQNLATGVGDLKRVLTNVKVRGNWGEIQLGALLEQVLSPEQYASNVAVVPGSSERVEFVVKLPGRDAHSGHVLLPIDAKFPQEDYLRLVDAHDVADAVAFESAAKALEQRVRACAKDIATKYLHPPHTTDIGIMFLPTEGLYAEVARRPGLLETLQREHRVMVAGPSTLAALLNSLQMGFRTLAIQQRSSEVWSLLGVVKTQFAQFETVLQRVHKKLQEAGNTIERAQTRTRVMGRKLEDVEALAIPDADDLLLDPVRADAAHPAGAAIPGAAVPGAAANGSASRPRTAGAGSAASPGGSALPGGVAPGHAAADRTAIGGEASIAPRLTITPANGSGD